MVKSRLHGRAERGFFKISKLADEFKIFEMSWNWVPGHLPSAPFFKFSDSWLSGLFE